MAVAAGVSEGLLFTELDRYFTNILDVYYRLPETNNVMQQL